MVGSEHDRSALSAQVRSPWTEEMRLGPFSRRCQGPGPDGRDVAGRHHTGGPLCGLGGGGDDGAERTHTEALVESSTASVG